jgi:beta-glucosidase
MPNSPQWPFGFGLSYTTFQYSEPEIMNAKSGQIYLQVKVNVTNTGKVAGEEVAQLYVKDLVGSVTRPVKELKGFQKIMLQPGETKTLTFTLGKKDLSFYRKNMTFGTERGDYEIMVGGDSENLKKVKTYINR